MTNSEIVQIVKASIFTWTEDNVMEYLCEAARSAKVIVETGCYMGATARAMLMAAPQDAHLWTIDTFAVAGTEFTSRLNLQPWIRAGRCELIVGDSQRGAEMLWHMKGKVDLVMVDDGHAEEDVLRDIRCLKPLLRPGGVMLGHDFEVPHNDVARGVVRSAIPYDIPVPRLWRHIAP